MPKRSITVTKGIDKRGKTVVTYIKPDAARKRASPRPRGRGAIRITVRLPR